MLNIFEQQKVFIDACDQLPSLANAAMYRDLIYEEAEVEMEEAWQELKDAESLEDLKAAITNLTDASIDGIVVIIGFMYALGITNPMQFWSEVLSSNMTKVNSETGKVIKNKAGKVLKPEGYVKPNLRALVDANWATIERSLRTRLKADGSPFEDLKNVKEILGEVH